MNEFSDAIFLLCYAAALAITALLAITTVLIYGGFQHLKFRITELWWGAMAIWFMCLIVGNDIWERFLVRIFVAIFIAPYSPKARCKYDMHDWFDSSADPATPMHFYTYTCKRCGKEFDI